MCETRAVVCEIARMVLWLDEALHPAKIMQSPLPCHAVALPQVCPQTRISRRHLQASIKGLNILFTSYQLHAQPVPHHIY